MAKHYQPRMHSAEHILNQVMVRKFDCDRCFSAHINKKKSKCDYNFERGLTDVEASEIEHGVNEAISSGLVVTEQMISLKEADERFNLTRLPEGVTEVRVVNIGDFDACPCIGEHVENSNEIGEFKMVSHSFDDGVLRIRYKLGEPEI
ncbi:hypothetical protein [Maridesulfovibrio salexigens]|uniref:Threonyl/alanyl tRNA synthetase SAD n=1 Tax=Maridesulfovibrio salexigens (strain ATCC 14822 / DSM 2638 / NCIMB 8403 / VKM B-1763) TaxID=526222 RepID=C6C1X0_MARSD|nr:hypothetical protein [Maridesulfovibrio salexigens]ACS79366.1 Threonyl/alanyl tRNA synthetase SAD [Maridesulfovibrio salexigens DSM 2638]